MCIACLVVIVAFFAHAAEHRPFLVFFDSNEATLTPDAERILKYAATQALNHPDYRLEVIGHDDSFLPELQSLMLSQERATETARYLAEKGVPENRILVGGVGSMDPLVPTAKGVKEAQNRFVTIQIVSAAEKI
jgi:OOP family OmpA-OmpF porin